MLTGDRRANGAARGGGGEGLELRCTPEDAMGILQSVQRVHSEPVPAGVSAVELLKREAAATSVRTGAAGLDGLLGTGVPTGKITEFCGAPGIGKTQLGFVAACTGGAPAGTRPTQLARRGRTAVAGGRTGYNSRSTCNFPSRAEALGATRSTSVRALDAGRGTDAAPSPPLIPQAGGHGA